MLIHGGPGRTAQEATPYVLSLAQSRKNTEDHGYAPDGGQGLTANPSRPCHRIGGRPVCCKHHSGKGSGRTAHRAGRLLTGDTGFGKELDGPAFGRHRSGQRLLVDAIAFVRETPDLPEHVSHAHVVFEDPRELHLLEATSDPVAPHGVDDHQCQGRA